MKTLYIVNNLVEILIAYPSRFGRDSIDQLHTWVEGDLSSRELFIAKNKQEAIDLYNQYNNG
jgi:hypothetical protein